MIIMDWKRDMIFKRFVICGFLIFLTSCSWYMVGANKNVPRPKKPDFSLAGKFVYQPLIDTNVIYVCKCPSYGTPGPPTFIYSRFFSNGRMISSNGCSDEIDFEYNNFLENKIGYYKVQYGEIQIENYEFYGGGASYLTYRGRVENGNIKITSMQARNGPVVELNDIYEKRKMENLKGVPNW